MYESDRKQNSRQMVIIVNRILNQLRMINRSVRVNRNKNHILDSSLVYDYSNKV
jgi:hypothetical protein